MSLRLARTGFGIGLPRLVNPAMRGAEPSPDNRGELLQALLFESGQAWEHFRHTENLASQYLAFYGVIASVYAGIMGVVFSHGNNHAMAGNLTALAVTGPLVGTLGVAVLGKLEWLRFVRDFYYQELVKIRSHVFGTLAHDPAVNWAEELDIVPAIREFHGRLKKKRKVPHLGLYHGSNPALSVIPLVFLGEPAYALVASLHLTFSRAQLAVTAVACAYSLAILIISIDIYRLYRKGEFGDKPLVTP